MKILVSLGFPKSSLWEKGLRINNFGGKIIPENLIKKKESDTGKEQSIKQVSMNGLPLWGNGAQLYQGSSEKWCITISKLSYWVAKESGCIFIPIPAPYWLVDVLGSINYHKYLDCSIHVDSKTFLGHRPLPGRRRGESMGPKDIVWRWPLEWGKGIWTEVLRNVMVTILLILN